MAPLRLLTVDDESLALRRLQLVLRTLPNVDHVGEAGGCAEALAKIKTLRPDVLLLDITLRDGSGFDIAEQVLAAPAPPALIFVTAFDRYAVEAFERAALDYLLKPVERTRLLQSIERARAWLARAQAEQRVAELTDVVRTLRPEGCGDAPSRYASEFWVRNAAGLVLVPVDAIDCVGSEDDYVAIHTRTGSYLLRTSLRQFAERVEPGLFVRVHRSWLVKRSAIVELRQRRLGAAEVVLRGGRRLPAGRVHFKELRKAIGATDPERWASAA